VVPSIINENEKKRAVLLFGKILQASSFVTEKRMFYDIDTGRRGEADQDRKRQLRYGRVHE